MKLLLIGTLPPPVGGASVLLELLVKGLTERKDVSVTVVNTAGVRGHGVRGLFHLVGIIGEIFSVTRRVDLVSLHAAPSGLPIIGPIVLATARLWGRPMALRMFGGEGYCVHGSMRRAIARFVARRADLYLVETRELVRATQADGISHVDWYPNSRNMALPGEGTRREVRSCRRFVFLSHVRPTKGIHELIEAGERMGEGVSIDVYGPLLGGFSEENFAGLKRVKYRGVVTPGEAISVLCDYDALVLPTYWVGEGYPGIIIEAFAAGIPVVTTRWKCIPEIVDDSCSILVEPRNPDALHDALIKLAADDQLFARLCEGARCKRKLFDSRIWTDRFIEHCTDLVRPRRAESDEDASC